MDEPRSRTLKPPATATNGQGGGSIQVPLLIYRTPSTSAVRGRCVWPQVTTENLAALTDIQGYRAEFLKLFGFGVAGVNYETEVDPHVPMP